MPFIDSEAWEWIYVDESKIIRSKVNNLSEDNQKQKSILWILSFVVVAVVVIGFI